MSVHVVPARAAHIGRIMHELRERDRRALSVGWGERPEETMERGIKQSTRAITMLAGLQPLCMAGVRPVSIATQSFLLWIVPTRFIDDHPLAFARASRRWLPLLMRGVRIASNMVERDDRPALRWAQWLGASLRPYDQVHDQFFLYGREALWRPACRSAAE